MTLSEEEAIAFIAGVLKLKNGPEKLKHNRADFLDELIRAFFASVHFRM